MLLFIGSSIVYLLPCLLTLFVILAIIRIGNIKIVLTIFAGFILRLIALFADYYDWFPVFGSGADTEVFHRIAMHNIENGNIYVFTNYTIFLTLVYYITDCSRFIAQYLNVLFGIGEMIFVYEALSLLKLSNKTIVLMMRVLAFLPMKICFSAILLREAWVFFFMALAVYYFVNWYVNEKKLSIFLSLCATLTASWMHAGCIFFAVTPLIALITYSHHTKRIKLSIGRIIAGSMVSLVFLVFLFANMDSFGQKLEEADVETELVGRYSSKTEAGSKYLQWVDVNSPIQGVLFSPLKMFYFLFSPIPFDWRGMTDLIGFIFDGMVYFLLCYNIYQNSRKRKISIDKISSIKKYLLIGFLLLTFVFSFGTSTAGTAMRHRAKYLSVLIVLSSLCVKSTVSKK